MFWQSPRTLLGGSTNLVEADCQSALTKVQAGLNKRRSARDCEDQGSGCQPFARIAARFDDEPTGGVARAHAGDPAEEVMSDSKLLSQARSYCDPETGEVVKRIPDRLMRQLRDANLARGVPGRHSEATKSHATWFVFLNDNVRDLRLKEWRAANKQRKRSRSG